MNNPNFSPPVLLRAAAGGSFSPSGRPELSSTPGPGAWGGLWSWRWSQLWWWVRLSWARVRSPLWWARRNRNLWWFPGRSRGKLSWAPATGTRPPRLRPGRAGRLSQQRALRSPRRWLSGRWWTRGRRRASGGRRWSEPTGFSPTPSASPAPALSASPSLSPAPSLSPVLSPVPSLFPSLWSALFLFPLPSVSLSPVPSLFPSPSPRRCRSLRRRRWGTRWKRHPPGWSWARPQVRLRGRGSSPGWWRRGWAPPWWRSRQLSSASRRCQRLDEEKRGNKRISDRHANETTSSTRVYGGKQLDVNLKYNLRNQIFL